MSIAYSNKTSQGEFIKNEASKYLRYWPFFIAGLVLSVIWAYLYLRYTPKVYQSTAKIKILNKTKGLELPSAAFVFNRSNINLENEIEILKSYRIIEQVVSNLNLTMRVYEEGNVLTTELYKLPFEVIKTIPNDSIKSFSRFVIEILPDGFAITNKRSDLRQEFKSVSTYAEPHNFPFELDFSGVKISDLQGKNYEIALAPISSMTRGLKSSVDVSMLGQASDILILNYASHSKRKNEQIINELIKVFNEDGINDRKEVSQRTMDFIDERFEYLVREIDSIESDIKSFKQDNDLVTIETDAELGISQRTAAEQELFKVENQLLLVKLLEETLKESGNDSDLLPANIGITSGDINGLVEAYNSLVLQRDNLGMSAAGNNPTIRLLNNQLSDLRRNIFKSIDNYENQLEITKTQLSKKTDRYASKVYSLPAKEKRINDITRQQAIKQSLYLFLLQKREEAAINNAITTPTIKVVEYALSKGSPIAPKPLIIYAIAVIAGLALPFGIIYALLLLDTKIKDRNDLSDTVSNIPVIGEIPKVKTVNGVFNTPNDNSVQAEAFRILSANADFILPPKEEGIGQVVFCTSHIKGEGKTYVSINLSLALASLNKKVLLIGADLRNPQVHSRIQRDKNELGLSNYLHDLSVDWKSALINGFERYPNHDILLSGAMPPNPAHLLTNGRFRQLIEEAKELYDYIIVDTAPTILVTDTMLISKLADATLYIVRGNYTEKKLLGHSKELFETHKLNNMAYVINSVGASRSYGYSYNYGYGYGYGGQA